MGLFDGCLLASDIDGTLVINGYINPKNVEKIRFFVDEGGCFSLATGRTVGALKPILRVIGKVGPSVVANGCMIYDCKMGVALTNKCIPSSDYHIADMIANSGIDVGVEIHSGEDILVTRRNSETEDHERYEELDSADVSFEEACRYDWNKVVYMFRSPDDVLKIKQLLNGVPHNSAFVDTSATLFGVKRYYYEQTPKGITKSAALDELKKILKIKDGCRFAIGDYYNDLEMIKNADIGAATVESPDDIKALADYVTVACKEGSVADFIDYLTNLRREEKNGRCI